MTPPNSTQTQFQPTISLRRLSKPALLLAGVLAVMSGPLAQAAQISKANNTDNLNLTTSWVGGVVPGASDTAVWDSTVTAANSTLLGVSSNWSGIKIVGPGGPVTISATSTNTALGATLTLNGNGVDMSGASQNLTISNGVTLNAPQYWKIASGRTLNMQGLLGKVTSIFLSSALRLNFADGTAQALIATNTTSAITNSPMTIRGSDFVTINDVDYGAVNALGQIVGGETISNPGSATGNIYSNNVTFANGASCGVMDFNYTNGTSGFTCGTSGGFIAGMRFNTPQTNTTYLYNGYPAWGITIASGRTLTVGGILVTTNAGNSAVLLGATSVAGNFRVINNTAYQSELLIFQNNPVAPLVLMPNVNLPDRGGNNAGLTKLGVGTFEVMGNGSYTAGTHLYEGKIRVSSAGSIGTNVLNVYGGTFVGCAGSHIFCSTNTVWPGGSFAVEVNTNNSQFVCSNLVLMAGSTLAITNNVTLSTTTAPLFVSGVNGLTAGNTVTLSIYAGGLTTGTYPLILSGTATALAANYTLGYLPPRVQAVLSNDLAQSTVYLVVTNINQPIKWATGSGTWDVGITADWKDTLAVTTTYNQDSWYGDQVLFEDTVSGTSPMTVTLNTNVIPGAVTVSAAKNYTISGTGSINGPSALVKSGAGTLTLQTLNNFNGGINLNAGVVNFNNISNLGVGVINFGGGTLQYNGNSDDISTRTVTFNAGGATIDLNGNAVIFTNAVGNNGAGGLTLTGGNTLLINRTNVYSGNTVINSGAKLAFQNTNTYINGSSAVIVNGTLDTKTNVSFTLSSTASQKLAGTGTVQGEIFTATGTTVSPATNGTTGTLTINGDLTVNGGTFAMDITGPSGSPKDLVAINNSGFGSGNLTLGSGASAGTILLNVSGTLNNGVYSLMTYSGSLSGGAGNLSLSGFSQSGQLAYLSSSANANGAINLNVISGNTNSVVWSGGLSANAWDVTTANWVVNGTPSGVYANGNKVLFNDSGSASPAISVNGTVVPGSVTLNVTNNNYTFADGSGNDSGLITGNSGLTINSGLPTTVTTLLIANNNTGPTVLNGGVLKVGNGGATGDTGSGNITNNGTLIYQQTDNRAVLGQISGTGSLVQQGATILALAANNTYAGLTTISNASSALQVGVGGVTGTLGTNAVVDNGTLIFNRSGNVVVSNNVSGSGGVAVKGTATISFGGNLAYQGNTYISNGVVKLTKSEVIPDAVNTSGSTGWLVMDGNNTAGTLDLAGFNETINALSGLAGSINGLITNTGTTGTNTLTILGTASTTNYCIIGDNAAGAKTRVVLLGANTLLLNNTNSWSGGMAIGTGATLGVGIAASGVPASAGSGDITMSNGATINMPTSLGTAANLANNIITPPNSIASFNSVFVGNGYSGNFIGDSTATNQVIGAISIGQGAIEQWTNFLGTVLVPSGGEIRISSTGLTLNGGDNTTFDLEGGGVLHTRNQGTIHLGALTGNGTLGTPTVATAFYATWMIGYKNLTDNLFVGSIVGSNSITKVGTNRMILAGTTNFTIVTVDESFNLTTNYLATNGLSFLGTLAVNDGVLSIVAPANLNGDPAATSGKPGVITMAGTNAVLDLSSMGYTTDGTNYTTNSTLTLGLTSQGTLNQALNGFGTIMGRVVAASGTTVTPGAPTGVLRITNSIELGGAVIMNFNRTNSPIYSEISSPIITIDGTATLVVTNAGPPVQGGEVFQLFSGPVAEANFASVTLPSIAPFTWIDRLAIDGSLVVSLSPSADLLGLVITPAGTLSPAFASNTFSYVTTEAYTNGSITVTVTNAFTSATNRLIFAGVTNIIASATASGALTLDPSPAITNVVKVQVNSQDGSTIHTYVVNVARLASRTPVTVTNSVSGSSLTLTWPVDHTTYRLQSQTNTAAVGLTTNWVDVAGANSTNKVIMPLVQTNANVFFRLIYP